MVEGDEQISTGEWVFAGIWAISTVFFAGMALAQSYSMKEVQKIFRDTMDRVTYKVDLLSERTARTEALIQQCSCLDGKPHRKCPEEL